MKTKIVKNQTPIDSDIHYKYRCPSSDCNIVHWLSLKEIQTKNFKVVCDCETIFQPKPIKKIKICFLKKQTEKQKEITNITQQVKETEVKSNIDKEILSKASDILCVYGFTKTEAEDMIVKSYYDNHEEDITLLVKQALKTLEIKNG